jgi:hypothetical protein
MLVNEKYFNISQSELASTISNLNLQLMIPNMIAAVLMTNLFDVFGRKYVMIILWCSSGVFVGLQPFTAPSFYPWFFLCKLGYTIVW